MSFKAFVSSAAIAGTLVTGTVLASAPAEAAILVGSRLNLQNVTRGGVSFSSGGGVGTLDFEGLAGGQAVGLGASTGSFTGATSLPLPLARIQDLTLTDIGGGMFEFTGLLPSFLSGIDLPGFPGGNDLQFDLTKFIFRQSTGDADIEGFFRLGSESIQGSGLFTTQTNLGNPSSFSLSIEAVPTPALLPGLIGMGVAALRRKKEEVEESA
ncbi:MAG: PTPA-CTERM sorting domain-containing protein [Tildeniella torsiva UHER 1998/13D]|jgi:hypothetical protein|nr:PTPA-CTERM sorting domain-containing protein [Tildeniella torsiva UHER 1998/13D]